MRIAMLEVGHWHTPMYLRAVSEMDGHQVVSVSDKNLNLAERRAEANGSRAYESSEEMLDKEKPDFAFIFGEHAEMPTLISMAIERDIPFCVEKPAALCADDLRPLAEQVKAKGLFNSVCYVYRSTPLVRKLMEWQAEGLLGAWTFLRFKYLTGSPLRYINWNSPWVLDPARSGGGTTIILSCHYIDLIRYLTGEEFDQVSGAYSNQTFQEKVDDHSALLLRTSGGTIGLVESGFTTAGNPDDRDVFELMTEKRQMIYSDLTGELRWWDRDGQEGIESIPKVQSRDLFVQDTLKAFAEGTPAPADLDDAVAVLDVLDRSKGD
jgi:predicted dehydrogenase